MGTNYCNVIGRWIKAATCRPSDGRQLIGVRRTDGWWRRRWYNVTLGCTVHNTHPNNSRKAKSFPSHKPHRFISQLSLAIPPWVGTVSTGESWDINRHTERCTSPVSMVWQCKLVSGWGLMERRSAPLYGPCGSGRALRLRFTYVPKMLQ